MAAVWVRARAELRKRWRAWMLLGIVFGVVAGAALTAAAGARRADSAYPRFVRAYKGYDVVLGGIPVDDPAEATRIQQTIIRFPEVADYALGQFVSFSAILPSGARVYFPEMLVGGDPNGHELITVSKGKVLQGRMFRLDAADEGVIDFNTADRFHLHVGDSVGIPLGDPNASAPDIVKVRIVGVLVAPQSMPAVGTSDLGGVEVTPAFLRAHASEIGPNTDAPAVLLKHGEADVQSFLARVNRLHANIDLPETIATRIAGVQKTLRYEVEALWILSGLIALSGIAIFGQAMARQVTREADDYPILLSLGMTPRQLIGAGMLRAAGIGLLASVLSAVVAIVASPLTPIGLSRLAEPAPGVRIDPLIVFGGAGIVFMIILLTSAVPVIRTARSASAALAKETSRVSRAASIAAGAGAPPSAVTGLRFAFESGRGSRSIPVRSALLGLVLAVVSFAAAGTFTTSLDHLIASPSLYGFGWDFIVAGGSTAQTLKGIEPDPDIEAISPGGAVNIRIGKTRLIPFAYEPGSGIAPTILEGRAPQAGDEIALGTSLFRSLHTRIGATLDVQVDQSVQTGQLKRQPSPKAMRVVGRTVVPTFFFQAVEPGQSSAITMDGYRRLLGGGLSREEENGIPLIVRYKQGTNVEAKFAAVQKKIPGLFTIQVRRAATELSAVSRSSGVPLTLTEVLLFMAVATLVHVLVTSVRKRRRDLAVLKTLGFVRSQIRAAVAWQATALTVVALAIGLPVGIAIGRRVWIAFAGSIGVVPAPSVRVLIVLLAIPAAIVAANVIAALPARAAARTKPALVLREE